MAKPTDTLARRGDGCVRVFTAAGPSQRSDVVENEGESEVDLRGRRRDRGESGGEWEQRPKGRGVGVLIHPDAGERVRWRPRPVAARVRGTGREGCGARSWAGWAGQAGCGPGGLGGGRAGGLGCLVQGASPPFFLLVFPFFSVLFSFRAFRHFIKWCLLHHNYQCNIWQTPNIFALTFENLGCLSLIHILN